MRKSRSSNLISISVENSNKTLNKGETATANVSVKSYDGEVTVRCTRGDATEVEVKEIKFNSGLRETVISFSLGEQTKPTEYIFEASPLNTLYSRFDRIKINVIDHCDSNACDHGKICIHSKRPPYYTCRCDPAFEGPACQDRKFVAMKTCKYHIYQGENHAFDDANISCSVLGGSLAMIKSSEIQTFLEAEVREQYRDNYDRSHAFWMGGFKDGNTTKWLWTDGTEIPMSGELQRWVDISKDQMTVSFHGNGTGARVIEWSSSNSGGKTNGYICEVPVKRHPCESRSCSNGGKCFVVGCQTNCQCAEGFSGVHCENGENKSIRMDHVTVTALAICFGVLFILYAIANLILCIYRPITVLSSTSGKISRGISFDRIKGCDGSIDDREAGDEPYQTTYMN